MYICNETVEGYISCDDALLISFVESSDHLKTGRNRKARRVGIKLNL